MLQTISLFFKADAVWINSVAHQNCLRCLGLWRYHLRAERQPRGNRRNRTQRSIKGRVLLFFILVGKSPGIDGKVAQAITQLHTRTLHLYLYFAELAVPRLI